MDYLECDIYDHGKKVTDCKFINGPVIIQPKVFNDNRGYFFESFSQKDFEKNIGQVNFVQDNESFSTAAGVIRGLHFQKGEFAQAKLVRVVQGAVLDVAVDIREESETFGKYVAVELTEENKTMLYIPRGFAHGFAVLTPNTKFQYKCDNFYAPQAEGSYRWNDPTFGIDWPFAENEVILSDKDKIAPLFTRS